MTRETALVLLSIIVYVSSAHKVEKAAAIPTRYNAWAAGSNNCSCASDITALKREILQEVHQRQELKGALETYVSELYELRALVTALKNATKGKCLFGHRTVSLTLSTYSCNKGRWVAYWL